MLRCSVHRAHLYPRSLGIHRLARPIYWLFRSKNYRLNFCTKQKFKASKHVPDVTKDQAEKDESSRPTPTEAKAEIFRRMKDLETVTDSLHPKPRFEKYSKLFQDALAFNYFVPEVFNAFTVNSQPATGHYNDMLYYAASLKNYDLCKEVFRTMCMTDPTIAAAADRRTLEIMFTVGAETDDTLTLSRAILYMKACDIPATSNHFRYVFEKMATAKNPDKEIAVEQLERLTDFLCDSDAQIDNDCVLEMVKAVRNCGAKPQLAERLWGQLMTKKKIHGDAVNTTAVIEAYAEINDVENSMRLFDQLRGSVEPYQKTYDVMNKLMLKADLKHIDAAISVFETQMENHMAPESTCVAYLELLAETRNRGRCYKLFKQWNKRHGPTMPVMNALCKVYSLAGDSLIRPIRKVFIHYEMEDKMDEVTFRYLLQMTVHDCDGGHGTSLVLDMEEKGFKPETLHYNCILAGWIRTSEHGFYAQQALNEMFEAGVKPNRKTWEILLSSYDCIETAMDEMKEDVKAGVYNEAVTDWIMSFQPKFYPDPPAPAVLAEMHSQVAACPDAPTLMTTLPPRVLSLTHSHWFAAIERLTLFKQDGKWSPPAIVRPTMNADALETLRKDQSVEQRDLERFLHLPAQLWSLGRPIPPDELPRCGAAFLGALKLKFEDFPMFTEQFVNAFGHQYMSMHYLSVSAVLAQIAPLRHQFADWFGFFGERVLRFADFRPDLSDYGGLELTGVAMALTLCESEHLEVTVHKIVEQVVSLQEYHLNDESTLPITDDDVRTIQECFRQINVPTDSLRLLGEGEVVEGAVVEGGEQIHRATKDNKGNDDSDQSPPPPPPSNPITRIAKSLQEARSPAEIASALRQAFATQQLNSTLAVLACKQLIRLKMKNSTTQNNDGSATPPVATTVEPDGSQSIRLEVVGSPESSNKVFATTANFADADTNNQMFAASETSLDCGPVNPTNFSVTQQVSKSNLTQTEPSELSAKSPEDTRSEIFRLSTLALKSGAAISSFQLSPLLTAFADSQLEYADHPGFVDAFLKMFDSSSRHLSDTSVASIFGQLCLIGTPLDRPEMAKAAERVLAAAMSSEADVNKVHPDVMVGWAAVYAATAAGRGSQGVSETVKPLFPAAAGGGVPPARAKFFSTVAVRLEQESSPISVKILAMLNRLNFKDPNFSDLFHRFQFDKVAEAMPLRFLSPLAQALAAAQIRAVRTMRVIGDRLAKMDVTNGGEAGRVAKMDVAKGGETDVIRAEIEGVPVGLARKWMIDVKSAFEKLEFTHSELNGKLAQLSDGVSASISNNKSSETHTPSTEVNPGSTDTQSVKSAQTTTSSVDNTSASNNLKSEANTQHNHISLSVSNMNSDIKTEYPSDRNHSSQSIQKYSLAKSVE
eukprot:833868_1